VVYNVINIIASNLRLKKLEAISPSVPQSKDHDEIKNNSHWELTSADTIMFFFKNGMTTCTIYLYYKK